MNNILLIASGNPGKVQEIKTILSQLDLELKTVIDSDSEEIEVRETGKTYLENARLKAEAYHKRTGWITLADDPGLEVEALDGAPGFDPLDIHRKKMQPMQTAGSIYCSSLGTNPNPGRHISIAPAALMVADNEVHFTEGRCEGLIIPEERGTGGFGYDPIFYIPDHHATMAQLSADLKNQISHRANALTAMIPILKEIYALHG